MKRICTSVILCVAILSGTFAQKTYVPDDIFEQYLINQGWDDVLDDSVLTANISTRTSVDVSYKGINDLTGIQDFISLQILHCEDNNLTELNIYPLTKLRQLYCWKNNLTELNLVNNTALELLVCYQNSIKTLSLMSLPKVTIVNCSNNDLTKLFLDGADALQNLTCDGNKLVNLNLSHNSALKNLSCSANNLKILNVRNGNNDILTSFNAINNPDLTCISVDDPDGANSGAEPYVWWSKPATASYSDNCDMPTTAIPDINFERALIDKGYDDAEDGYVITYNISQVAWLTVSGRNISDLTGIEDFAILEQLDCSNNQLTELDLTLNTTLTDLDCSNNSLTVLNVRSGFNYLLTTFNSTNNPDLTCISVDDEVKATSGEEPYTNWQKDAATGYSVNCDLYGQTVYVPDDNFEGYLIESGYDDAMDDYVNASTISVVTKLFMDSKLIKDLTGIEGFISLETLKCNNNLLQTLDISQNTALKTLECYTNHIASLDLSQNSLLSALNCTNNELTSLDLSGNPELSSLNCQNNQITALDFSNNPKLMSVQCRKNLITELDFSNNTEIHDIDCYNNQISTLNLTDLTNLFILDCGYNQMTSLTVTGSALTNLSCNDNLLTTLDLSTNDNISQLECMGNLLTSLEISNLHELWWLICKNNQLTSLNLCANNRLNNMDISHNPLTELILPNEPCAHKGNKDGKGINSDLTQLNISYTDLTSINVLDFEKLNNLNVSQSKLDSLDVSDNIVLQYLNTTGTPLGCIQVNQDQLNSIPSGWVKDESTVYATDCSAVSIRDKVNEHESLRISMDPTKGMLNIQADYPVDFVEIYSLTGQKLLRITSGFETISISNLNPGIYLIKVVSGRRFETRKFSLQ